MAFPQVFENLHLHSAFGLHYGPHRTGIGGRRADMSIVETRALLSKLRFTFTPIFFPIE